MTVKLRRLSHSLGAEVCDIDLREPLSDSQFSEIREALLTHGILLFRGQEITRQHHLDFSRRFGELDRHDSIPRDRDPACHELLVITNAPKASGQPSDTKYTGRNWHTDFSFALKPPLGSLLRAITVPEIGGDTMFANMYLAYDTLSAGMKELIAKLHGVHLTGTRKIVELSMEREEERKRLNPPVAQPVVRIHPETGRKALYLGTKVKHFEGMTEDESKPLIDFLNAHATRPEFVYRHQWRRNDVLMWDNRCTMHMALGDYDEAELRHMERTTVIGTPSGHIASQ